MKETVQLSIGGYAFTLDTDAAEALQAYMDKLEAHYLPQDGGKEIMEGIEERMAELLLEKGSGVVSLAAVQGAIDVIGRPETIEADDPEPSASSGEKPRRRLFRDPSNKRLGGVCSGLAMYFGLDVSWIRLGFAVAATAVFFSGVHDGVWSLSVPFLYCLLWVAMPAARTAQDRWAMKGDSGKADDIRRNVQNGIHEMGDTAREVVRSDFFQRFGRVLLLAVGIVLLIIGSSGLASISVLSLKGTELFGIPYSQWLDRMSEEAPVVIDLLGTPWVVALVALAVILPFVGLLYAGIQLLFGFKSPSWKPGLVIFVLWLIIIIVLLVLFIATAASAEFGFCQ